MLGDVAGGPAHAVFGVKLCRECPPGQTVVHPVLGEPGGELAVAVETESQTSVADDVVDRTEPVVGAAGRHVEDRVRALTVVGGRAKLQDTVGPDTFGQLLPRYVRLGAARAHDSNGRSRPAAGEPGEPAVRLPPQVDVGSAHHGVCRFPGRVEEGRGDEVRLLEVDVVQARSRGGARSSIVHHDHNRPDRVHRCDVSQSARLLGPSW